MGYFRTQNEKKIVRRFVNSQPRGIGWPYLVWVDHKMGNMHKIYSEHQPGYMKWIRRQANRRVRHAKDITNGNAYKRKYNY